MLTYTVRIHGMSHGTTHPVSAEEQAFLKRSIQVSGTFPALSTPRQKPEKGKKR